MKYPDFSYEKNYWKKGYYVIGVDEVGRGALAGPVYVGAVCLCPPETNNSAWTKYQINDSKLVLPNKRQQLSNMIRQQSCAYSIASSDVNTINKKGIVYAVHTAVRQAVKNLVKTFLPEKPVFLLLDAFRIKYIPETGLKNQLAIIKGDQKCLSIAAASIIAKVERDRIMTQLAGQDNRYLWDKNKGYGTKDHREALKLCGATKLHRKLFIRKLGIIG